MMSNPIYVQNVSDLQLSQLVARERNGYADLLPGEFGKIPAEIVNQQRIQSWIESGRLKVITEAEFEAHFAFRTPVKGEVSVTYKTKATPQKQEDGATVLVPGLDELPETDEVPSPDVTNLDGVVSVRAPADNEPLTDDSSEEEASEPVDLRPRTLSEDGRLTIMNQSKAEAEAEANSADEAVVEHSESSLNNEPLIGDVLSPTSTDDLGEPPSVSEAITVEALPSNTANVQQPSAEQKAEQIIALGAWRKQAKALKEVSDPAVITALHGKTTMSVIKNLCEEKLNS